MPTIGPVNFASAVNDESNGAPAFSTWTNPNLALLSDDKYAESPGGFGGGAYMQRLRATDASAGLAAIADDDRATEVVIAVERRSTAENQCYDVELKLVVGGVVQAENLARVGVWPTSDTEVLYTFSTNLAGAQVKAADFGVVLGAGEVNLGRLRVDRIRLHSLTYTPAADGVLEAVADAVTDEINTALAAGELGAAHTEIEAEWSFADWDDALADLDALHIDVVPAADDNPRVSLESRGAWDYEVAIDVGVRFRFGTDEQDPDSGRIDKSEVAALTKLLQRIAEHFMPAQPNQGGRELSALPEAVWLPEVGRGKSGTEFRASFDREMLRVNRQFLGIVRLTYSVPRTPGE